MSGISTQRLSDLKDSNALVATPEEVRRMAEELFARRIGAIKGPPAAPPPSRWSPILDKCVADKRKVFVMLEGRPGPTGFIRAHELAGFYEIEVFMRHRADDNPNEVSPRFAEQLVFHADSVTCVQPVPRAIEHEDEHGRLVENRAGLSPEELVALGLDAVIDAEPLVGNGG